MTQNIDKYYWLFSSSAQAISAFVAFLITGYTLVLTIMNNLQQKDETYEEIHEVIRKTYYSRIKWLLGFTGAAIILSLMMILINGNSHSICRIILYVFTILVNLGAIIIGILFVAKIIDPDKYKKAARQMIKEEKIESNLQSENIDNVLFIKAFIDLEIIIRNIFLSKLNSENFKIPFTNKPLSSFSFREMILTLYQNEIIDTIQFEKLRTLNKYRNLVVHGHLDKVDNKLFEKALDAKIFLEKISSKDQI